MMGLSKRKLLAWFRSSVGVFWFIVTIFSCTHTSSQTEGSKPTSNNDLKISFFPPNPQQGDLVRMEIEFVPPSEPGTIRAFSREFPVYSLDAKTKFAFLAIPLEFSGKTLVEVQNARGTENIDLEVLPRKFEEEVIAIPPKFHKLSKKDRARAEREAVEVGKIYRKISQEPHWKQGFIRPMDTDLTSTFGAKRLFNGELKSQHYGQDFRARTPMEIRSSGKGVVVLAKDLFYSGKSVIIDHGHGLFTLYFHLSKLLVKPNETVDKGKLIGLTGNTGRVSGPHLHWSAAIQNLKVDPLSLMKSFERVPR